MTVLCVFQESGEGPLEIIRDPAAIANRMTILGALFERWEADRELAPTASQNDVLEAYRESVERLKGKYGFQSADVISVHAEHPQKTELRAKFLNEHIHSDFEVRFFVEGRGLFYLHPDNHVYALLCERGDLISVPDHLPHWFDMGSEPDLKCIRLFTTPEGWVADFTGVPIGDRFPKLEAFREAYA
jgi:1,2-dihydroxy-3-keto-5-methylthiopentene dioxygenase